MRTAAVIVIALIVGLVPWLKQRPANESFCLPYKADILVCSERTLRWAPLAFVQTPTWWVNR